MKKYLLVMMMSTVAIIGNGQAGENSIKQRVINVQGTAEMEIVPDEIYVQIRLREYAKKGGPKTDIESIRNSFIKAALSLGIADSNIVVEGYSGWDGTYYWYKKNSKKAPDMMAGITYLVKLSTVKKMDELVAKLDDEATEGFTIERVSHSKITEFRKQLKMQAVKAAKEKAAYLSEAIGEKVGEALVINEPNEIGNFPRPMYSNMMLKRANVAEDQAPEANIDFKKMKLQFEVSVTFALK